MARRKSDAQAPESADAAAAAGAPAAKGRNNLIPAVVLAIGLAAAGYLFSSGGKGGSASAATAEAAAAATTPTTVPEGEIVKLDATTLNLADNHFLKLGLALQLKKGVKVETYATKSARALDLAITLYGSRAYAELNNPQARERAKAELADEVKAAYGGEVTGILYTEFVMQ